MLCEDSCTPERGRTGTSICLYLHSSELMPMGSKLISQQGTPCTIHPPSLIWRTWLWRETLPLTSKAALSGGSVLGGLSRGDFVHQRETATPVDAGSTDLAAEDTEPFDGKGQMKRQDLIPHLQYERRWGHRRPIQRRSPSSMCQHRACSSA
jgi:hypothetical protein